VSASLSPSRSKSIAPRAEEAADYSLKILWSLARYVEDKFGVQQLDQIADRCKISATDLDGSSKWTSHTNFEAFMGEVRALVDSDDAFEQACVYRFSDSYGYLKYALRALSLGGIFARSPRISRTVLRGSRFETVASSETSYRVRYYTNYKACRAKRNGQQRHCFGICRLQRLWITNVSRAVTPVANIRSVGRRAHARNTHSLLELRAWR
jgi:hypothetical protein